MLVVRSTDANSEPYEPVSQSWALAFNVVAFPLTMLIVCVCVSVRKPASDTVWEGDSRLDIIGARASVHYSPRKGYHTGTVRSSKGVHYRL